MQLTPRRSGGKSAPARRKTSDIVRTLSDFWIVAAQASFDIRDFVPTGHDSKHDDAGWRRPAREHAQIPQKRAGDGALRGSQVMDVAHVA